MTMYLEHFGLREAPFRITPHTEFFFSGANRGATLEALMYAITAGEGMVKVTGEVGSGKTMLCRVLMERLPQTVETIYLAVPSLTRDEMLASIASDLEIDTTGANTTKLVRALQERLIEIHAGGRQVVALIDEAHAMPLATLEEIRLLSNLETGKEKLLQIVLFGQPELDQHLALPHMRQLKERITHSFALAPLPAREVRDYVNFRLRAAGYHGPDLFGEDALRLIAEASEGLTRRINIYADKTLLAAFASGTHTVSADHARAAISDTQIVVNRRASPRRLAVVAGGALAVGAALGFGIAQMMAPPAMPTAQAAHADPAPAPTPATSAASTPPPAATPIPVSASATAPAAAPAAGTETDPVALRVAAGRDLLADGSPARFAVQLMVTAARDRPYLAAYLGEAGKTVGPERLYVVPTAGGDGDRVGVLYGAFASRDEAATAMNALPEGLRQFHPFVRSVDGVREDARRIARR
ncbi:MAG TPA: AAA family ATPase [Usitatibacter sp.]|jgi:type II secretory pathway predicted ATPase ExeA|nr:AAA family ATPase [Usitatibacter sp.]